MSKVPSLNYDRVVKALERSGFAVIRQKESYNKNGKKIRKRNYKNYGAGSQTYKTFHVIAYFKAG
jgi:hypothetical protein